MSRVELPAKLLGETVAEAFDFTSRMGPAETISSASVAVSVFSGTDPSPSSMRNGSASISGQVVTQSITGGVLGVLYLLVCTVTTSLSQVLQLSAYLPVAPDEQ